MAVWVRRTPFREPLAGPVPWPCGCIADGRVAHGTLGTHGIWLEPHFLAGFPATPGPRTRIMTLLDKDTGVTPTHRGEATQLSGTG